MTSMSSKRISNGAIIDCSHPSKRSACKNIHRETDAANGIALPFIMFRQLPAKPAETVADVPSIFASTSPPPPSEPAKFVPSPEALEFLSALFFRSYVAPRFKVPFGVYDPVDAPCSTYVEPEEQLSLLAHKLQSFDITTVHVEWTVIQVETPALGAAPSKKKPDSLDKLSAQLTKNSLESLRKELAKPNEALTTRVTKRVFSKRSRPLVQLSPLNIASLTAIHDDSATSSHRSDASSVFSDSDDEDSRSGTTYCSSEKQLLKHSSLVSESVASSTADPTVRDTRCKNESVETQEENTSLKDDQCGNLTCNNTSTRKPSIGEARSGQDVKLDLNVIPERYNNSIPSDLALDEVLQCVPIDHDMIADQITPPCLHNNDVTEVMETTLMQHEDLSEAEVPYSEILSEAELSFSADITQDDSLLDEENLVLSPPEIAIDLVQEPRVTDISFPQACDTFPGDTYLAGPFLSPENNHSYTEIAFAQTTPIFDSGEPSTPVCKLFPDSTPLPTWAVDAAPEYEDSDGCDCAEDFDECVSEDDRGTNDQPKLRSPVMTDGQEPDAPKVIAISLEGGDSSTGVSLDTTSPLGDIDAEFEARGWTLGGSWQDDDELDDPVPSKLQVVKQVIPSAYEKSRFGNICKNLNITCVSDGFYRWNPGN
ncbi:uncharacterized protein H6S33_003221 [Morchella sextelata]|uniref:uncharacterized protein n=1 Tax=Morchella sextelata TaxID=1174677 RepID=UPI001D050C08|nr:uncharacterized protein H6S33_003221 [Morchella sextelata]KAH0607233.1 hypothetical protein H6S33_003221 [Morchella sextelata]